MPTWIALKVIMLNEVSGERQIPHNFTHIRNKPTKMNKANQSKREIQRTEQWLSEENVGEGTKWLKGVNCRVTDRD